MPRKIVTEDGSELEVPTDEELKALQDAASKSGALEKDVETLKAEIARYDSDPVEKNWRELRTKTERLEEQLRTQGKTVGADGTITDAPKSMSIEEIESRARSAARSELVGQQKKNLLSRYDEETRKVVEHYYNKLSTGEEVSVDNIEKFISEAALLANPTTLKTMGRMPSVNGQPPVLNKPGDGTFADTEAGKSLANELFGEDSYAKK